jgi:small subunit ribosomal protein S6
MYFKTSPETILELERNYRINEDVIRFIVLKYEKKSEVEAWQDMVNKALAKSKKDEAPKAE